MGEEIQRVEGFRRDLSSLATMDGAMDASARAVDAAVKATEHLAEVKKNLQQEEDERACVMCASEDSELLDLNVGGEIITVLRKTLLLAPDGSWLRQRFQVALGDFPGCPSSDENGNEFLNFPADTFKIIVDYLRVLHSAPLDELVWPPRVPAELAGEFWHVAWLVGVDSLLNKGAQPGRGPRRGIPAPTRRRGWLHRLCGRRRRRLATYCHAGDGDDDSDDEILFVDDMPPVLKRSNTVTSNTSLTSKGSRTSSGSSQDQWNSYRTVDL